MQTTQDLIRDISQGARAAHAFVVEGRAGEARDAFIQELVAGLECRAADAAQRPCHSCESCRQIAAGTSLDIVTMNKSTGSSKTAKATYKVSDAAAFIERLSMGAYGRYLIGIINDADSLSEVIQNKLLKTLEEPGEDTILILAASNRDNLLDTVRSRCSDIRMESFGSGDDEEVENTSAKLEELCKLLMERKSDFYEFRAASDKNLKSSDDALVLLEMLEDSLRAGMLNSCGFQDNLSQESIQGNQAAGMQAAEAYASAIEAVNVARMDIRRDMGYAKALRRLFLELH